jgi:hypothetical protein
MDVVLEGTPYGAVEESEVTSPIAELVDDS